jgi:hypothetical protein
LYDALVDEETQWLSGKFLTFLNKLVLPILWFAILLGVPLWVIATAGQISVASGFRFIVAFFLIATVPLTWLTFHLQRVGYSGRTLVIGNYLREARIPFEDVEAVEPVWWYRGRLVRIRFKSRTPFGSLVYYMPKWGPMRAMISQPEKDLQRLIWPEVS